MADPKPGDVTFTRPTALGGPGRVHLPSDMLAFIAAALGAPPKPAAPKTPPEDDDSAKKAAEDAAAALIKAAVLAGFVVLPGQLANPAPMALRQGAMAPIGRPANATEVSSLLVDVSNNSSLMLPTTKAEEGSANHLNEWAFSISDSSKERSNGPYGRSPNPPLTSFQQSGSPFSAPEAGEDSQFATAVAGQDDGVYSRTGVNEGNPWTPLDALYAEPIGASRESSSPQNSLSAGRDILANVDAIANPFPTDGMIILGSPVSSFDPRQATGLPGAVFYDWKDELIMDRRCGRKLGHVWISIMLDFFNQQWILLLHITIYERCVDVVTGGAKYLGVDIDGDPRLPTIPLFDLPWAQFKSLRGHRVRMALFRFKPGDRVEVVERAANDKFRDMERGGAVVVVNCDCPGWKLHIFKFGSVTTTFCGKGIDPDVTNTGGGKAPEWEEDTLAGVGPEMKKVPPAGGEVGVDAAGEFVKEIIMTGELKGWETYTVRRSFLAVLCCNGEVLGAFYYEVHRKYKFTCKGNTSKFDGWESSGVDPVALDPGNPLAGDNEKGLLAAARVLVAKLKDCTK